VKWERDFCLKNTNFSLAISEYILLEQHTETGKKKKEKKKKIKKTQFEMFLCSFES